MPREESVSRADLPARGVLALLGLPLALAVGGQRGAWAYCAGLALIVLLWPVLTRYALARPNARSSHKRPVPQGGGLAVLLAAGAALVLAVASQPTGLPTPSLPAQPPYLALAIATALLALVGAVDDIRPLPAWPKLLVQAGAVALVLWSLPPAYRLGPEWLPLSVERVLAIVAGLWFLNLTNFIDGIDGITLANTLPVAGAVVLLALFGRASHGAFWLAGALFGAVLAFLPFNWPPARLFLGDVGSLPLGLLLAWLLHDVAMSAGVAAALILPCYPVMDATITLLRRLRRGEKVWEAHRQHFYQQAVDGGWSALRVSGATLALNLLLVGLAISAALVSRTDWSLAALGLAVLLTGLLLRTFAQVGAARANGRSA